MYRLSMMQFKNYLGQLHYSRILLCSFNQTFIGEDSPIVASLSFDKILATTNSDIIYLKKNEDYVYFRKVKFVEVNTDISILGVVINVVCDDKHKEVKYTLVAA